MASIQASFILNFDNRSVGKLRTALIDATAKEINKVLNKNKKLITSHIQKIVRENLENSPEVKSLSDDNGKLRIELGVVDGAGDINALINEIISRIVIDIKKTGTPSKEIEINITIHIDGEYASLYSQKYSSYISKGGTQVEWLKWLLEAGNADVVFGYKIKYGVEVGRTGDAIMMPNKNANWRVPPEFSGVVDNNFITRSFENIDQQLLQFIGNIFK